MAKQEFPPLLPRGFHQMTLDQMRVDFVNAFGGSRRRKPVMDGLEKVVQRIVSARLEGDIWIDGSFLTKKTDPDDSDLILIMDAEFYSRATPVQKQIVDWVRSNLYHSHYCHSHVLFQHPAGHPEHTDSVWFHAYWLRQFGFSRRDEPKGIVLIKTP
jgi:hypothetical protein